MSNTENLYTLNIMFTGESLDLIKRLNGGA